MKYNEGAPDLTQFNKQIEANMQAFEQVLQSMAPELYAIHIVMKNSGVSSEVVAKFAIELGKLLQQENAYGRVWVDIQGGKTRFVRARNDVLISDFDEQ